MATRVLSQEGYDQSLKNYMFQPASNIFRNGICSRCRSIDFEAIDAINVQGFVDAQTRLSSQDVFWPPSTNGSSTQGFYQNRDALIFTVVPIFDLGPEISPELTTCRVCRFWKAVSRHPGDSSTASRWYLGISTLKQKRLYLVGRSRNWQEETRKRGEILISVPFPKDDTRTYARPQNPFTDSRIHYGVLSNRIQACIKEDTDYSIKNPISTDAASISWLKLIDCARRQVIDAPDGVQYTALSYVWGHNPPPNAVYSLPDGKIIESKLTKTLVDAMTVTIALGLNHLWVDRYCVDQSDEEIKAKQIGEMHHIFSRAWVTIVALGSNDQSGIAGVSSRRARLFVSTPQCELFHTGPDVVSSHALSDWSLRAWTYQECFLSPRLLSFTPVEAVLVCQHGSVHEIYPQDPHRRWRNWAESGCYPDEFDVPVNKAKILGSNYGIVLNLQDAMNNYCSRALTYELDALTAFSGYLSCLDMVICKGIPLFPAANLRPEDTTNARLRQAKLIGGSVGLAWLEKTAKVDSTTSMSQNTLHSDTSKDGAICEAFPSWSWASCRPGSKAFSSFTLKEDRIIPSQFITAAAEIYSEYTGGQQLSWTDLTRNTESHLSNSLGLRSRITTFSIPVQQVDDFIYDLNIALFSSIVDVCTFAGVEFSWPICTNSTQLGLGTATIEFHPDRRPQCKCHAQLNVSPRPQEMTAAVTGVAALLFVEKQEMWEQYAIAHWLALRYDDTTNAMRRVGVLRISFAAPGNISGQKHIDREGEKAQAFETQWKRLAEALDADLKEVDHVGWVKMR